MNKHLRRGHAGFSMVELLVTIVIAGIAFAAMVPLFIQAQTTGSQDRAKTVAVNIAQDKIEKIRTLDYDDLAANSANPTSTPNLYNPSFAGGVFGPAVVTQVGSASKTFTVDYAVIEVTPSGSTTGVIAYKEVTVTVTWPGRGTVQSRRVVLQTKVSRQDSGPQITNLSVSPLSSDVDHEGSYIHTSSSTSTTVTVTATIATADRQRVGRVEFRIDRLDGTGSYTSTVSYDSSDSQHVNGVFTWTWVAPAGIADDMYTFSAVAYTGTLLVGPSPAPTPSPSPTLGIVSGQPGNVWQLSYGLDKGAPGAVTITGTAGAAATSLSLSSLGDTDIDHYDVFRRISSTTWETDPYASVARNSTFYVDRNVTSGMSYDYRLQAVDTYGLRGAFSNTVTLTPTASGDVTAPSVPTSLTATVRESDVRLTWVASADSGSGGAPSSGLMAYEVFRGTTLIATVSSQQTSYNDTPGWSSTAQSYSYTVRAVDYALNTSAFSSAATATIPAAWTGSIKVVAYNQSATVTLTYLDPDPDVTKGTKAVTANSTTGQTWTGLWYGSYRVTAVCYAGTVPITKVQTVTVAGSSPVPVAFTF